MTDKKRRRSRFMVRTSSYRYTWMKSLLNKVSAGLGLLIFAATFGLLCLHTRRYLPFIADDALISLRYAKRFAQGLGLTWNDG